MKLVKVAVRQDLTRAPEDIRPEREEILAAAPDRAEDVLAKKAQEDPSHIDLTGALLMRADVHIGCQTLDLDKPLKETGGVDLMQALHKWFKPSP
ncbi:hypothetical protein Q1695_003907 [Nippostrongylus brasiliensis]|nr:hypothetical protein Q1695_003907 [Nippostrongylus brasiliensis]